MLRSRVGVGVQQVVDEVVLPYGGGVHVTPYVHEGGQGARGHALQALGGHGGGVGSEAEERALAGVVAEESVQIDESVVRRISVLIRVIYYEIKT